MYPFSLEQIIILSIICVTALVFLFLLVVSIRRVRKSRYYKRLDIAREKYRAILLQALTDGLPIPDECYRIKRFSPEWQAIEEILLSSGEDKLIPMTSVTACLDRLGYIDVYMKRLRTGNRFHRALATEKLGRLKAAKASVDLLNALNDPSREVRIVAVRAVGEINATEALRPLADLLVSTAQNPESLPLRILKTAIKKFKGEAIPYLVPLLCHSFWRVRAQAADLIGEIGILEHSEVLMSKLEDPEPDVRAKIARALGKIKAREAVYLLANRIKDPSWVVRLQTAKALGLIGGSDVVPLLLELVSDVNWQVRAAAANSLCRLGNFAIPGLLKMLLRSRDRYAREQIVEELQKTDVLKIQIDRLGSTNKKEREVSSILLVAAGNNGAINLIADEIKSQFNPAIRMRLVQVLSLIDHPRSVEILKELSESDENEGVRYVAKKVLEKSPQSGGKDFDLDFHNNMV